MQKHQPIDWLDPKKTIEIKGTALARLREWMLNMTLEDDNLLTMKQNQHDIHSGETILHVQ